MSQGDTEYLKMHAFLLFRFRPEMYWFSLVQVFRGLLLSLISIIPNVVCCIVLMQILLIFQQAFTVKLRPWRVLYANVLDVVLTLTIVVLLSISAFFVDTSNALQPVAVLGAFVVGFLGLAVVPTVCWGIYKFWTLRKMKPFTHFICNHKAGSGSFARLLKQRLSNISKSAFLDADDLVDVEQGFDYVGQQTSLFVILCSKDIFMQPWCLGEMVHAMKNGVQAVKVVFPDFAEPDKDFIENITSYVPNITCLADRGVALTDYHDVLNWTQTLETVYLPTVLNEEAVAKVVQGLVAGDPKTMTIQSKTDLFPETSVAILVNHDVVEDTATAMVLSDMLRPLMGHSPAEVPAILPAQATLPESVEKIVILCTSGAFKNAHVLRTLMAAAKRRSKYLLVISDIAFRFPTSELLTEAAAIAAGVTDEREILLQLVQDIFVSNSVSFQPELYMSSAIALETKAKQVFERLKETHVKLSTLSWKGRTEQIAFAEKECHIVLQEPEDLFVV